MALFAVFSKCLAMVRYDGNESSVVKTARPQPHQQLADCRVNVSNLTVVGRGGVSDFERRRRFVRIMWVVEMHPKKERAAGMLVEPRQSVVHDRHAPSFHAVIAVFTHPVSVEP